jgi:hypothetical protein
MSSPWNAPVETTPTEDKLLGLLKKQKLWIFLRLHRHLIIDDEVRERLVRMYASSGRGKPVSAERLTLALVLQVFTGLADHEVPIATATDRRWRMVLDLLDEEVDEKAFSQGTVFNFRERARAHGLMEFLLEKTVSLARETKGYSHKRLRMMIDSSPLVGAGRVEDTFNLIGRAIGQLTAVAAEQAGRSTAELAEELELSVVSASSVKAALDVDWRLPHARNEALNVLIEQFAQLRVWLEGQFEEEALATPPLSESIEVVERLIEQDTEPDPDDPSSGARQIRQGGEDRQVSLSDPDMRHGRKSKTKLFVGYKRHISVDADVPGLVTGVEVLPANVHEYAAAQPLLESAENAGFEVTEAHHDRGYLASEALHERRAKGMRMLSKPPTPPRTRKRLGKADFAIDTQTGTVTCPAGHTKTVHHGKTRSSASFTRSICTQCSRMSECLPKHGQKVIVLHPHEDLFQQWAAELATAEGREARRARVAVEHALGKLSSIQGNKARYRGLDKVQFHTVCCALVANLHVLDRLYAEAA